MRADACGLVLSPFKFFSLQAAKNKTCSNIDLLYGVLLSVLHYAMNKIINYTRDVTSDNTRCTIQFPIPLRVKVSMVLPCCRPRNNELRCVGETKIFNTFFKKRTETSLHEKISKKKSSWCQERIIGLTMHMHKQGMPNSDMHSITCVRPHLFNNLSYISSSGTATYV